MGEIYYGIDPGRRGAIVGVNADLRVVCQYLLRYDAGLVDISTIDTALYLPAMVVLEHQQGRTGEGQVGVGAMMRNFGRIEGYLLALAIPHAVLRPSPRSGWMTVLEGVEGADAKERSIALVKRMLPDLDLTPGRMRNPHDGLAQAGAMAIKAREMMR